MHQSNQRSLERVTCTLVHHDQQSCSHAGGGHSRRSPKLCEDAVVFRGFLRSRRVPQPLWWWGQTSDPERFLPQRDKPFKPCWVWKQASNFLLLHLSKKGRSLGFLLFQSVRSHTLSLPAGDGRVHRQGRRTMCHSTRLQPPRGQSELGALGRDLASRPGVVLSCPRKRGLWIGGQLAPLCLTGEVEEQETDRYAVLQAREVLSSIWESTGRSPFCASCPALRTWRLLAGAGEQQHPHFPKENTPQSEL